MLINCIMNSDYDELYEEWSDVLDKRSDKIRIAATPGESKPKGVNDLNVRFLVPMLRLRWGYDHEWNLKV